MNGNDVTQIKDGETNDANARYEANIDGQGVKDERDAEETIGEDIDLSLLHEDDDAADSDLERSNDDTEAIKLLNEDDDAFESFLEGEGSSSDNLIGNSGENTAIENNHHNVVRHSVLDFSKYMIMHKYNILLYFSWALISLVISHSIIVHCII